MNKKEYAIYLANKFVSKSIFDMNDEELKQERILAKKYALICIDEIIKATKSNFYTDVKIEIEKLNS